MGYGPIVNGKQLPICKWEGSWAHDQEMKRKNHVPMYHEPSCNKRLYPHYFPGKPCNCSPKPYASIGV